MNNECNKEVNEGASQNELDVNQLFSNCNSGNKSIKDNHEDYEFYDKNHLIDSDDYKNKLIKDEVNQINHRR